MSRLSRRLAQPWARSGAGYSIPGTLILKLRLGEVPDDIPPRLDVQRYFKDSHSFLDVEPVDRILKHFTDECRTSLLHSPRTAWSESGPSTLHFDDVEHAIGLSRTLYLEIDDDCAIFELIDGLRQLAIVEEVSPQYLCTVPAGTHVDALNPKDALWPRDQIHAAEALAFEPGDSTVIVGVIDTGVERNHPELRRRLRSGFNTVDFEKSDLATGVHLVGNWSGPDADPEDFVGHGTACAAIIGALGEHIPPGVAGECRLLPIRVLAAAMLPGRDEPVGIGAVYDIDLGMKRAIDLGAKVLNMSFGTSANTLEPGDPKPHSDVVKYGVARGCIMIAASGNSGIEEQFYPAAHDGVLAVGAVDKTGHPSSFSTRGKHVAISSPGEDIVSANLRGYAKASGTSFATPFVTAAAALLVSYAEGKAVPLSGSDVRKCLTSSAQTFPAGADAHGCGAGILDCHAALRILDRQISESVTNRNSAAMGAAYE
jgi:subtilisin family serine protease